jgi:phosphate/sulfate permease
MRLLAFTLLAITIGTGIQYGLVHLPNSAAHALDGFTLALALVLPMMATAGLARAMRISHVGYVIFLAILSPFIAWILAFFFTYDVLNEPLHYL